MRFRQSIQTFLRSNKRIQGRRSKMCCACAFVGMSIFFSVYLYFVTPPFVFIAYRSAIHYEEWSGEITPPYGNGDNVN